MRRSSTFIRATAILVVAVGLSVVPGEAQAIGLLVPDRGEVRPFDVESHRVDVTITNNAAVTEVVQVFRNHTDRRQEATFVFPLPRGATVNGFSLWMNGEEVEGAVLEAREARETYESIVSRVEDPGLVEYAGGQLFRASIFPIPANSTKKLKLTFNQTLDRRAGLYRYTYPMGAGSTYAKEAEGEFTFTGTIQSPLSVANVYSPTHEMRTAEEEDGRVRVGAERMEERLDRDLQLYVGYSKRDIGFNLMSYDAGGGGEGGYFMAALAPRVDLEADRESRQAYTFVIDTSGSMDGEKIEQARETLKFCIEQTDESHRFNIVDFSTGVDRLFDDPERADDAARDRGLEYTEQLTAAGGTAVMGALEEVLEQEIPENYVHHVVFVTDGEPTVGETDIRTIVEDVDAELEPNERLFSFGVGYDVNTRLVDGLAKRGRGRSDYVKPDGDLEGAVSALYTRISSPVLSEIDVDFGGADAYDVYPKPTPDLFRGDQVVLFGRYRGSFDETITVRGRAAGAEQTFEFDPAGREGNDRTYEGASIASSELAFIPELWATRKVGYLLEQIRLNGERPELRAEVVRLAETYGLVTPYTSYLAVDDREMRRRRGRTRGSADTEGRAEESRQRDVQAESPRPSSSSSAASSAHRSRSRPPSGSGGSRGSSSGDEATTGEERPELALDEAEPFGSATGSEAVERAEETEQLKEKKHVGGDENRRRRYVAGRTFVFRDGAWVQNGVDVGEGSDAEVETVEIYSERFFELVGSYDVLGRIAGVGDEVIVELGGEIYRLVAGD